MLTKLLNLSKIYSVLVFLLIYISGLVLYNYLSIDYLKIWQIIIIQIVVWGGLTYLLMIQLIASLETKLFYCTLLLITIVEFFLVLIPWPTNNESKSVLLIIITYIAWGLINLHLTNQLVWKNLKPFIIIGLLMIIGVISSITWQGY